MRFATSSVGRQHTTDGWSPSAKFLLFSTETGDASLLDPSDHFAAGLARDIEGPAFVYTDRRSRRVSTILGYPINLLGNQHPEISNIFG